MDIFPKLWSSVVREDFSDSWSSDQKCKNLIIDSFINDLPKNLFTTSCKRFIIIRI